LFQQWAMLLFRIDCVGGLRLNETESRRVRKESQGRR
jgi:hypothetical protein